ncbi:hypothetical protein [Methanocella conradii]|uniref:hypothetical protein n=1 Tax=Methanocella conradii TaxID=1175444 RepID=UPI0024B358F2|nr:hypothetical protein [Methanocella conradii]MDI6898027.1 hypothetical protein [Methanocella conradii]
MKNNKIIYLMLGASIIIGCIVLIFLGNNIQTMASMMPSTSPVNKLQKPLWKVGDWWIIEESQQIVQAAVDNPPWSGPYKWKMEVTGIQRVDGKDCFIVVSTSEDFPDIKDILYYSTENLSIVRKESITPSYHDISDGWDVQSTPSLYMVPSFPAKAVEIPISIESFDVPGASADKAVVDYSKVMQGKADAKGYKVDISHKGGYDGYEVWHQNAPWWLYYNKTIVKARLIDCSWWHG